MNYARFFIRGIMVFALALGLFSIAAAYMYLLIKTFFRTFHMLMF
jgi:hypothetical protein